MKAKKKCFFFIFKDYFFNIEGGAYTEICQKDKKIVSIFWMFDMSWMFPEN